MNKRGLSTIIVTLILIALALVAIGIFWIVVRNMINQQTSGISFEKFTVNMDIEQVYSPGGNNVAVQVKRNPGKGEITGVKFIFYNETGNEVVSGNTSLSELETRTFTFALNMNVAGITKVSIAPIFESTETGNIADTYELTEMTSGTGACTPTTCSALGYTCGTWSNGTCSGSLFCGNCSTGYSCVSGTCQSGTCSPATCVGLGYQCGTWGNGTCSGSLFCGNCSTGYSCVSGSCVASCTPTTCSALGYTCGTWANGTCSGSLNCGSCSSGYSCVGGTCQAITGLCSNLVLLMHFDADISPTSDSSGNNNNGIVNGSTWTSSGRFNGAFTYDGINDFINAGNSNLLNFNASFTISTWVKTPSSSGTNKMILGRSTTGYYLDAGEKGYYLIIQNSSTTDLVQFNVGGNLSRVGISFNGVNDDQWHHITGMRNTTGFYFYTDGTLRGSTTVNIGDMSTLGEFLYMGRNRGISGYYFNGTIDDIAMWNRSLTLSEISNIYSSGSAISC